MDNTRFLPLRSLGILVLAVAAIAGCSGTDQEVTLPEGTGLVVSLDRPLSTEIHRADEHFGAVITRPVRVGEHTVLPVGTEVRGRLLEVDSSDTVEDGAQMTLVIAAVQTGGDELRSIQTAPLQLVTAANPLSEGDEIVVGDAPGAVLGMDTASPSGGFLTVAAFDGEIVLRAGQRLRFTLTEPITMVVPEQTARAGM